LEDNDEYLVVNVVCVACLNRQIDGECIILHEQNESEVKLPANLEK